MKKEKLGVDIGGVIIDRANDGTDTSFFSENYLKTTAVIDAFVVLKKLVEIRFGEEVYLVSKCGKNVAGKTLRWFDHHDFYTLTGIQKDHVHFCRERYQKAGICEELDITHFIDDKLEVLSYLTSVRSLYLFQPVPTEVQRFTRFLDRVTQVNSWEEVRTQLL